MVKKVAFFVIVVVFALSACSPSSKAISEAIAKTQAANPTSYPTQTLYPTHTPYPTGTPTPESTLTPTETPQFEPLTWAELENFLLDDRTNWSIYTDDYNCVNFSLDLVSSAKTKRIEAWIVAVTFEKPVLGHAFVAFPTTDRGVIWVEPQSDLMYLNSKVDDFLCLANNPNLCSDGGKLIRIIQPATCDPISHQCW